MFKQCLIVLIFKDAHSSNCIFFQQGSCLHQRVLLFPKYGSLSWIHVARVLHLRKYIVKRALHVQEDSFLT